MRKKFTMLFAALLACGGAMAQMVEGSYYRIKWADHQDSDLYLTIDGYNGAGATGARGTVPFMEKAEANPDQVWTVENTGTENEYYLKSKSGYYIVHGGWNIDAYNTGNKGKVSFEVSGEAYKIKNLNAAGNWYKVEIPNGGGDYYYPYCDCTGSNGTIATFTFEEVDVVAEFGATVMVTYIYQIDGKEYKRTEVEQDVNSEVEVPAEAFVTVNSTTGTIGEEDCEIIVNCSENLPFGVTEDLNAPVWQVVEMHRYGSVFRVWEYSAIDEPVAVKDYAANKIESVNDNALWCFTGNLIDGFKIYNKAASTAYTLNAAGTISVGTASEGNDVWNLVKSSATNESAACFTNDATNYMNQQSAQLKYHNAPDNGSTCYFYYPSAVALSVADEIKNIPAGIVGAYVISDENQDAFDNAYEACGADETDFDACLDLIAAIRTIQEGDKVELTQGYYFVKATGNGNNANWYVTYNDNSEFVANASENPGAEHVWKFEVCEDGYKLQSCNLGKYVNTLATAPATTSVTSDSNSGAKFVFENAGAAKFIIKDVNSNVMRTENQGQINYWSGETGESWYLIPVTELEISINEYASICMPFDVKVVGATAYAVTETATETVTLAEKADVPAGEGAILEGNGTATLVLTTATSDWSGNLLEGTTVATEIEGKSYILANGTNGIGLYNVKLTDGKFINGANKAYLPAPAGTEVAMFSFGRGEGTTGIEQIVNNENVVIYDLAGRRVQKMEKGIYIVNGKKVIR